MKPLADLALSAVNRGDVTFIPNNYEKIFRYWMENALDWNISRQIVWGIPIPAWLCDTCNLHNASAEADAPNCEICHAPMRPDTDTFDTWFSSGQWPLITTNYPDGKDFKTYYPTDVMETGHDLIFKWIPRMIFFGLYLAESPPFHTVYLHGLVNDAHGKKMSKSKGNVVDPITLTDKYGTDALRLALVVGNAPGTDLSLSEDKVKGYKHFANKLWNISRFVLENSPETDVALPLHEEDLALIKECGELVFDVTKDMEEYRFHVAAEKLYAYTWHRLADVILEESKAIFKEGGIRVHSRQVVLRTILEMILKALHPFAPFVTEEIWTTMYPEKLLMIESWPTTK